MPSVVDVSDQLAAAALPVLFLDTCILLDVIRAIKRRYKNCVEHAARLLDTASAATPQCVVVISHLVRHEWGANEQALLDEATRHLAEIEDQSGHFHDACDVFGIVRTFPRANYAALGVADRLHDLSRHLLNCALVVDPDNECSGQAMHRVIHGIPPSKQGGEAKDCTILEECLAVCRRLHGAGFPRKLVFCTSNTNDYCERSPHLHATLASDFNAVGLHFTTNLPWAFHDLMH
jgi:hypothetical protein